MGAKPELKDAKVWINETRYFDAISPVSSERDIGGSCHGFVPVSLKQCLPEGCPQAFQITLPSSAVS